MKSKMFLTAALVIISSVAAFAAPERKQIPNEVISAFNTDFDASVKVTWETGTGYFKAGFIQSGVLCYAFYSMDGELMGMGRQLTTDMIPASLGEQLESVYSGYTLTELYQIGTEESGDYLLVLRKGNE